MKVKILLKTIILLAGFLLQILMPGLTTAGVIVVVAIMFILAPW